MNAVTSTSTRTMYSAQLAHGLNIVTNLRLVNTGGVSRSVTLTAIGDDGTPLAEPVLVDIDSEEIYSADLGTLFGLEGEGVIYTGSLVVESDGSGIIGDIVFADGDTLNYAMALPLQEKLFKEAVFNHISNLPTVFTGFAFYNPGDATATVLIEAFGVEDEGKVAEKTLILGRVKGLPGLSMIPISGRHSQPSQEALSRFKVTSPSRGNSSSGTDLCATWQPYLPQPERRLCLTRNIES